MTDPERDSWGCDRGDGTGESGTEYDGGDGFGVTGLEFGDGDAGTGNGGGDGRGWLPPEVNSD